ncbi:MAG TPA: OmpA family protein [Candidatus Eisenbacteria bacterium]|nr:OmpA family protein [Candidatus Eisenbacteria bacterium]
MGRGTVVALVLTCILVSVVTAPRAGRAGLGDALKKKASEAAKKGGEAADKATKTETPAEPAKSTPADEPEKASGGASGAGTGPGQVSAVSTKFDFVPGDSVMFFDDFTQDELGEFPQKWRLVGGTFEVAEMNGERWARCVSPDGHIRMKIPAGLPEFWTLEFDLYEEAMPTNFTLNLNGVTQAGDVVWEVMFPYGGVSLAFRSGDIFAQTPLEGGTANGRHHVMISGRGTALKAYMDRQRLANAPDVTARGTAADFDLRLFSPNKPMITQVRLAKGPRPAKDLLSEGKLVTHGILFETGSDVVLPESAPVLRQVAAWMEANAAAKLRITGHTDNVGAAASNLDLSKRRAASVAKVLSTQFAVGADRFTTDGKGDTQPVSSNAKPEGRAMNRRVEFAKL